MVFESKLKFDDENLHPVLRHLAKECIGKINLDYLLRKNGNERVVLRLVSEKTSERKFAGIAPRSASMIREKKLVSSVLSEPYFSDVYKYGVNFCYVLGKSSDIRAEVLHAELNGIDNEVDGQLELEKIAEDLKRVYHLNYVPMVFRH